MSAWATIAASIVPRGYFVALAAWQRRWPPGIGDAPWCLCSLRTDCATSSGPGWAGTSADTIVVKLHPRCPMHRKMSRREWRGVVRRIMGRAGRLHGMSQPTGHGPDRAKP